METNNTNLRNRSEIEKLLESYAAGEKLHKGHRGPDGEPCIEYAMCVQSANLLRWVLNIGEPELNKTVADHLAGYEQFLEKTQETSISE